MTKQELASMIDHTLLKPEALPAQIDALCDEAEKYGFASVCVNPVYAAQASRRLKGSPIKVCSVVGFPLGATTPAAKVGETIDAITKGATEIDMVLPIGLLRAGMFEEVRYDIAQVCEAARSRKALIKVIFEISALTDAEIISAAGICNDIEVDYIKTSTGFGAGGASLERVRLMRSLCKGNLKVKASGGIRTLSDALAMIDAGASRLGLSSSVEIIESLKD